jgi:hypothetical protein
MNILTFNIEYGGYVRQLTHKIYTNIILDNKIDIFFCTEPHHPKIILSKNNKSKTKKRVDYNTGYGHNIMNKVIIDLEKKGFKYYHLEAKGFEYYTSIISRYPIYKTKSPLIFKTIIPTNQEEIYLIPVHLSDTPFTFYSIRDISYDKTPSLKQISNKKQIVELSYSTKSKYIEKILKYISRYPDKKYIIAGDFNEPSHLDDNKNEWIISKKFENIGILDTYRIIQNKKNTKQYLDKYGYNMEGATCCNTENLTIKCRIDFIYSKNLDIKDSQVLSKYSKLSDHLPVLTKFDI